MKVNWEFDLPKDLEEYQRVLNSRGFETKIRELQREVAYLYEASGKINNLMDACKNQGKTIDDLISSVNWFVISTFEDRELIEDAYNEALNRDMEK